MIEGALEATEALENVDATTAEVAAQNALAALSERVKVVGGQPVVQINIVNVGGTVALPGAAAEAPPAALPAGKVTVVETTDEAEAAKEGGKKKAAKK